MQVNTKVDMRLRLDAASWLDDEIREAVRRMVSQPPALPAAFSASAKLPCVP